MAIRKTITSFIDFFHFPFLHFIPKQTFRYLFCGVSTIVVDWVVFYVTFHFVFKNPFPVDIKMPFGYENINFIQPETLALMCAFIAGFIWGFGLNKYVVFTQSVIRGRIQLFRYAIIVSTCILLNILLMHLFIRKMDIYPFPARIITSLMVAVYSYLVQRSFTFKVKSSIKDEDNNEPELMDL
jgi:putative flippase GtrA